MHTPAFFTLTRACLGLLLCTSLAPGQAGRAELFGTVRDAAGLVVSGASLELRNDAVQVVYKATSTPEGEYHFAALTPGPYRLSVQKPGFATLERDKIILRVADRISLDLALTLGESSQTVEVSATTPLAQTTTGTVSFHVEERKVVTLPLDGRNFVPLIALSPGVMLPPGQVLPRINGSRPRTSEYLYDGISVLQPEPGQVAYYPIIDSIAEFRVQVNSYSAEYGRSNGGIIQVNSKSGTGQWHGSLFEFFRNEALNARNLFATTGPKPLFRRNQYGVTLGGPIQHDRTFFFADWQQTRLATGVTRFSTVPTSRQRQGIFTTPVYDPSTTVRTDTGYERTAFPNQTIPLSRIDPAAARLLARYPLPNVFTSNGAEASANNYQRTGNDQTMADQFDTRVDRYFGANHRVFGRYSFLRDDSSPTTPLPDGSGDITSGVTGNRLTRGDSVVAEHAWTLSPASVNQLRFGYTHRGFDQTALRTGQPVSQSLGIPGIPTGDFGDTLPTFQLTGYQQIGPPLNANSRFTTSVTQLLDTYSTVRSRHSLKAGFDLRRERLDVLQPPSPTGTFQFSPVLTSALTTSGSPVTNTGNSVASFLLGQVQNYSIDQQQQTLQPRATIAELFIQDDWRVTSRLTLNLGLRYTLNFPSTEAKNRAAVFNLQTQQLDFLGRNGVPESARDLEKLNFGPRVALAYAVSPSFIVRSGYGLVWIEQAGITTPFTTPLFPFIQTLSQPSLDNINPAFVLSQGPQPVAFDPTPQAGLGQGVFGTQRDNGSGYAQQWNLTLQKTLGSDWSVEVGYLGSKITRLGVPDVNLNQLRVEQLPLRGALTQSTANPYYAQIPITSSLGRTTIPQQQLLRPFPRFTTVTLYRNNTGNSTYHALQAHMEKRFSHGLTLTAAYTFAKLIDDAGAVFDAAILTGPVSNYQAADSFNRRLEKDESTGSIPHVFSTGFVYEIPSGRTALLKGWRVAGIVRAQSGMPLAVTQATNLNAAFGFGIQRPNRIANPNLPNDERTTGRYFDTSAFTQAGQFTIGNSSRNPVRGPGYQAADVMMGKYIRFGDRWNAELRAEAFNVTNTPPLANPNGSFGAAAFGTITSALDPRVFELVLKLSF